MRALQYLHTRQSGRKGREQQEKSSWEQAERIAKVAAQFAAILVPVGGLLGVCAVAIGQAYVGAYYQAKGIPIGLLPLKVPENQFVGWMYLAFAMDDLFVASAWVLGLTGLVTMLFSQLHGCADRCRVAFLFLALGSVVIVLLSLRGKLVLPWWVYYLVTSVGLAGLMTWWLLRSHHEKDAGFKKRIDIINWLVVVGGSLVGIALFITTSLWMIVSAIAEAQTRGWENGCARVTQSPEIVFSLSSENSDIQQFVLLSQGEGKAKLYKGRLLLQTDDSYYLFTETITTTNPFTGNLRLFPTDVVTQGCSPAQVIVLPAADVHVVKLIPRYEPSSLCGQNIEP